VSVVKTRSKIKEKYEMLKGEKAISK